MVVVATTSEFAIGRGFCDGRIRMMRGRTKTGYKRMYTIGLIVILAGIHNVAAVSCSTRTMEFPRDVWRSLFYIWSCFVFEFCRGSYIYIYVYTCTFVHLLQCVNICIILCIRNKVTRVTTVYYVYVLRATRLSRDFLRSSTSWQNSRRRRLGTRCAAVVYRRFVLQFLKREKRKEKRSSPVETYGHASSPRPKSMILCLGTPISCASYRSSQKSARRWWHEIRTRVGCVITFSPRSCTHRIDLSIYHRIATSLYGFNP